MYRSKTTRRLGVVVLLTFMLSGGVLGAWLNIFDLATCKARGGKIVGRKDPGNT